MGLIRREVRCCCQPNKLLGWLDVREDADHIMFMISPEPKRVPRMIDHTQETMQVERVVLDVARLRRPEGDIIAIKDNGLSIDKLRRIPGFIENVTLTPVPRA